jgi:hypothetical protein
MCLCIRHLISIESTPSRFSSVKQRNRNGSRRWNSSCILYFFYGTALISVVIQVQLRDVPKCPITGLRFRQSEDKKLGMASQVGVGSELAHIIPFSLHFKVRRTYSFLSKDAYDSFCRPKPIWPSRRSQVAPSRRKILLNLSIPPKMLYFCNTTPIRSMITYFHGASRL